MNTSQIPG